MSQVQWYWSDAWPGLSSHFCTSELTPHVSITDFVERGLKSPWKAPNWKKDMCTQNFTAFIIGNTNGQSTVAH